MSVSDVHFRVRLRGKGRAMHMPRTWHACACTHLLVRLRREGDRVERDELLVHELLHALVALALLARVRVRVRVRVKVEW